MSRREPAVGSDLPRTDVPSPEVLDELLRAFSADVDDHERLAAVDLTSPEVDALLTPPGTATQSAASGDDAGAAGTTAGDAGAGELVGDESDAVRDPDPLDLIDEPHQVTDEPDDGDTSGQTTGEPGARHVTDATDETGARAGDSGLAAGGEPPDDTAGHLPTETPPEGAVAGDPLLGATAAASGESDDDADGSTVRIVDDDLPDAVYIGGSLEPAAPARPTVFIDGDVEAADGSPMSMEDASSAAHIEPRLRDRRIAVKRAAGRKRLKWMLAITVVVVLVIAALAVLGSGLFSIDEVRVEGAEQTDPDALAEIVADLEGRPVLRVDTDAIEARLETLPWVDDARVTTDFPDGATIELRERTAVATVQDRDGGWSILDADGRVLAASEEQPDGLTAIIVPDLPAVEVAKFAPQGVGGAATLIRSLTPLIESRTEAVIVTPDGGDLRLTLTGGTEVRFGAADDIVAKLVRLQTMLTALGTRPVRYIDVSTNDIGTG